MICRSGLLIAALLGTAPGLRAEAVRLPGGVVLAEVDFERHVAALLGKMGCNAGACHGSFQGKGGLRLSLFGHDADRDYLELTRGAMGRRIDTAAPDRSLLLLKATARVPHEGGKRFEADSWQAAVFRAWIAAGCRHAPGSGRVRRLEVLPRVYVFAKPGETVALRITAEFADGSREDVTPFCDFRVPDDAVAEVSPPGVVRALRSGDTPVIVHCRGELAAIRVLVPAANAEPWPKIHPENFIDAEVFAKLRQLRLTPSELSSDAEFLRRASIDAIGSLPSPAAVREFLADVRPDKRLRKIEELLAHPLHAALWAMRLCDLTGCNVDVLDGPAELRSKRAQLWHDWFRVRIAANEPFDRIVRGVLCATSREGLDVESWVRREAELDRALRRGFDADYARRSGLDLYWRRFSGEEYFPLEEMAERTAAAFLGVRLECAGCHKHPYDRWTQTDYRAFANVFAQVRFGNSPETTAVMADLLERRRSGAKTGPPLPRVQEVYVSNRSLRRLPCPDTGRPLPARALGGPEIPWDGDAREGLARWLTQQGNPFFAVNVVNRVWAHYLGAGLVEPVDAFSVANPPANEKLLEALARDFIDHGFDLRRLERLILTSRTYQLSSRPNAVNARDRTNASHARVRPMLAEVVVDVLNDALGTREDLGSDAPPGRRAIEIGTNRVRPPYLARAFRVFGRPARTAVCDCQRPTDPALPQTLFLMTDPVLLKKLSGGRLAQLLAEGRCDAEIVEELFLAALARFPDEAEKRAALEHVRAAADRKAALADALWALVNTREFILNH